MVEPAELGALAGEGAGLGRGQLELVGPARDDVQLEVERRHPEGVDDVRRGQVELRPTRSPAATARRASPACRSPRRLPARRRCPCS